MLIPRSTGGAGGGGGATTFTALTDCPASIVASDLVMGNAGGTALEFQDTSTIVMGATWKDAKRDYGMVADGVTNDTTAFNNAIASGNHIRLPDGPILINGALTSITTQGQRIEGVGWSRTTAPFVYAGTRIIQSSATANVFTLLAPRPSIRHLAIIRSDALATAGIGIEWGDTTARYWCNIEDILIEYMYTGIKLNNVGNGHFENVNIYRSLNHGLHVRTPVPNGDTKFNNVTVAACTYGTGVAYYIEGGDLLHFINCKALNNVNNLKINTDYSAIYNLLFNNCSFENGSANYVAHITKTSNTNWGVQFIGCEFGAGGTKGIYIGNSVTDYKFIGGEIQNINAAGSNSFELHGQRTQVLGVNMNTNTGDAFNIGATASGIQLIGNQTTGVSGYGMNIASGATYITAIGNDFRGCTSGASSIAAGVKATSRFRDNQGMVDYETSVAGTPDFIGQMALVAGQWYMAKAVSAPTDWVLLG